MTDDRKPLEGSLPGSEDEPGVSANDTSGVVEGPVGSAALKPPADAEASSADLAALPAIDADEAGHAR